MMSDNGESKPGHHRFDELKIGAGAAQAPFHITIDTEGEHVVMKFEFRLKREEALKFATIMMNKAIATKP